MIFNEYLIDFKETNKLVIHNYLMNILTEYITTEQGDICWNASDH